MAATYTRQYRPVSSFETATNSAVSVRTVSDMADSVNNLKAFVRRQKIISYMFPDPIVTRSDGVEWLVLPPLAPRFMPDGYSYMHACLHAERSAGAGNTTLKIYFATSLYRGQENMVTPPIPNISLSLTLGATGIFDDVSSTSLTIPVDDEQRTWPFITCNSAVGTTHKIRTLDVWVSRFETY